MSIKSLKFLDEFQKISEVDQDVKVQLGQGLLWTDDTKSVKRLSVLLTLLLVVVLGCCRVGCVVACLPVENACKFAQRNPNQTNVQDGNDLWVHLRGRVA